jgi:hypothetical protein
MMRILFYCGMSVMGDGAPHCELGPTGSVLLAFVLRIRIETHGNNTILFLF